MNGAKEHWDSEYSKGSPHFAALSSDKPSSAVIKFVESLQRHGVSLSGYLLEVGCGMGRNANFLASLGFDVTAFDVSTVAVEEAKKRAQSLGLEINYGQWDASDYWEFAKTDSFEAIVDVTTMHLMSDFERRKYKKQVIRTLSPGGRFLVYTLDGTVDKNAQKLVKDHPGLDPNSYILPGMGHQEKVFMREDLEELFDPLEVEEVELIQAATKFGGEVFDRYYWWMVFRKASV
jgi:2-polyprenyl-3-methyl-5-hydroxy-6-metoxy-1,4-benzoquinol methylase